MNLKVLVTLAFVLWNGNFEVEAGACGRHFDLVEGDYPGWGQVGSYSDVRFTWECAELCIYQTHPACRSYEYSTTEKICNLNTVGGPTEGKYKDYAFCVANSDTRYLQWEISLKRHDAKIARKKKADAKQRACNAKRPSWCKLSIGSWNGEMECRCNCTCGEGSLVG